MIFGNHERDFNAVFCCIYFSVMISESKQNLLQPEYSVKVFNTENIILSLGDIDGDSNNDLELIKDVPRNRELDEKLQRFHKFVKNVQVTERPYEKVLLRRHKLVTYSPFYDISYPESPVEIAMDAKDLSVLERRRKKRKGRRKKRKRMQQLIKYPKRYKSKIVKRETANEPWELNGFVNYDQLKKEYLDFMEESLQKNETYRYTEEAKPEETLKEMIQNVADLKISQNCSNIKGMGVQAVECIVRKYKEKTVNNEEFLKKMFIIASFWFCVYLIIAIPLWCIKGWCCCCFRCSFCLPYKTIKDIQKYITENPPGVYVHADGEEERYNPTRRETQLYDKLRRSIADF